MVVDCGALCGTSIAVLSFVLRSSPPPLFLLSPRGVSSPSRGSPVSFRRFSLSPTPGWTGMAFILTVVAGFGVENLGQFPGASEAGWTGKSSELSSHQIPHPRGAPINSPS